MRQLAIVDDRKNKVKYSDLAVRDTFEITGSTNLYMAITDICNDYDDGDGEINTINLKTGTCVFIELDQEVIPVSCKLTIG